MIYKTIQYNVHYRNLPHDGVTPDISHVPSILQDDV